MIEQILLGRRTSHVQVDDPPRTGVKWGRWEIKPPAGVIAQDQYGPTRPRRTWRHARIGDGWSSTPPANAAVCWCESATASTSSKFNNTEATRAHADSSSADISRSTSTRRASKRRHEGRRLLGTIGIVPAGLSRCLQARFQHAGRPVSKRNPSANLTSSPDNPWMRRPKPRATSKDRIAKPTNACSGVLGRASSGMHTSAGCVEQSHRRVRAVNSIGVHTHRNRSSPVLLVQRASLYGLRHAIRLRGRPAGRA